MNDYKFTKNEFLLFVSILSVTYYVTFKYVLIYMINLVYLNQWGL